MTASSPLHVIERGEGAPAFLLLHGFGASGRLWAEVIEHLAAAHRCLAPDLRGFGCSVGVPTRVDDHLDDLQELVATCGLTDYVLGGHSMGGKIAAAFAARRPPGLRALVLIAASPLGPEPMDKASRQQLLNGHGDQAAVESLVDRITATPVAPAARAAFVADNVSTSARAWRWWLESGSRDDLSARGSEIDKPVYVLAGSRDAALGVAAQNEAVRALKARRLSIVADAGHLLPLESPSACAAFLIAAARDEGGAKASGAGAAPSEVRSEAAGAC